MPTATRRRPLPALAFLLALSILTGIVWWRVLHRSEESLATGTPTASQSARCTPGARAVRLPNPASVTVVVLNGAGRDQLANRVTSQLKSRGFTVGTPGRPGATLLSYYLPGAKLVPASRRDARIEVLLGSGFRSLATADTVKRAVASAGKTC
ncbi:MAG TPA: LytR C-terminal domain-containing protein [Jatrophihabitans sp.]|nr:LytR C-terminal domain-containing protein [Jatrophihabitans sp.]